MHPKVDDEELYDEEQVDDYRQEDTNIVEVRLSLFHTEDSPSPQHYPTASPPLLVVERDNRVQHNNSTTSPLHETGQEYNFFPTTRKIFYVET
jgi:hypothetical protein